MRVPENGAHSVTFHATRTALALRMFQSGVRRTGQIQRWTHRHRAAYFTLHAGACLARVKLPTFAIPVSFAGVGAGSSNLLDLGTLGTATTGNSDLMFGQTVVYRAGFSNAGDGGIRAAAPRTLIQVELIAGFVDACSQHARAFRRRQVSSTAFATRTTFSGIVNDLRAGTM